MRIWSLLSRLGIVNPFDAGEVDRAETENAMRDHDTVMHRIEGTIGKGVREAQLKLRASIEHSRSLSETAKRQPPPDMLAQLLHDMKSSGHDARGH
jgi:hypothetical protein